MTQLIQAIQIYLIPVPNEMARKYRYVTSPDELLAILTTNNLF